VDEKYIVDGQSYIIAGVAKTDYEDYLYLNDIPISQLNDLGAEMDKYNTVHDNKYSRIIVNEGFYAENYKEINIFTGAYSVFIQKKDAKSEWEIDWISDSFFSFDEGILNHPYKDQFLFVSEDFKELGDDEIIVSPISLAALNYLTGADGIYKIINKGIADENNVFDLLVEEELISGETEISIVSGDFVRIDEFPVRVSGIIDFEKYRQFLSSDKMYGYALENGGIFTPEDIEAFNLSEGHYQYKALTEYLRVRLNEKGIDVFTEEEFRQIEQGDYNEYIKELAEDNQVTVTVGHLKIQLEEADIDVFTEEEFNNQTIQGNYNEYIKELAEDNQVSATAEHLKIRLEVAGVEVLTEEEFNNQAIQGGYNRYLNKLAEENEIAVIDLYSQILSPVIMDKEKFNELNPYDINKVQNILVLLSDDVGYNHDFFVDIDKRDYQHNTLSGSTLGMVDDVIDALSSVFRYVSLGLAVFVIIFMFSNISASVLAAKKEIGTLRAIGARGRDVAMIFIIEAVILAAITSVFAIWVLVSITQRLNVYLTSQMGIPLTIFNPSIIIFGELVLLALVVAIVASFIPVKRVSLMKPIDAIKNK
jgi:ABC-type antimicrobial peptide transport system permease subunit